MRKTIILWLCICALMTVSCNNNKSSVKAGPSQRAVENAKKALTKDVMATLDNLEMQYMVSSQTIDVTGCIVSNLTTDEKMVKPDYLFEPKRAEEMLTKGQQVNALALLIVERPLRVIYDMPTDECDKAVASLVAALNHPVSLEECTNSAISDRVKKTYDKCKETGDVSYFWQFNLACLHSTCFLISQNSEIFFRNLDDQQVAAFIARIATVLRAADVLAPYDPDIATIISEIKKDDPQVAEWLNLGTEVPEFDVASAKAYFESRKEIFAKQHSMLFD